LRNGHGKKNAAVLNVESGEETRFNENKNEILSKKRYFILYINTVLYIFFVYLLNIIFYTIVLNYYYFFNY